MAKSMYIGIQNIPNLIPNGTFSNLNGWDISGVGGSSNAWVSDNALKLTAPSTSATHKWVYTTNTIKLISGHVYYCRAWVKKTGGGDTRWGMYNVTTKKSYWLQYIEDDYTALTRISYLYKATEDAETNFLLYSVGQKYVAGTITFWDHLFVVDLTALYGAGKEPTKAQCDSRFSSNSSTGVVSCTDNVGGKARKVKRAYIGIGGVARKIKKAYIGVNGVARLFYHQSIRMDYTPLSLARMFVLGGANSKYAIFAGSSTDTSGKIYLSMVGDVDAYDGDGVRTLPSSTITASNGPYGGRAGDYVVFLQGDAKSGGHAYDSSLTRKVCNKYRDDLGYSSALSFNDNLLVAGGSYYQSYYSYVYRVTPTLTRSSMTNMTQKVTSPNVAANKNFAVIAGGYTGDSRVATVTAYDTSFTKHTSAEDLSNGSDSRMAVSGDKYAMICNKAGQQVYDENLTKTVLSSYADRGGGATGFIDKKYVFMGGGNVNTVLYWDEDTLTAHNLGETLVYKRQRAGGALLNKKLILAGGHLSDYSLLDSVEVLDFNKFS